MILLLCLLVLFFVILVALLIFCFRLLCLFFVFCFVTICPSQKALPQSTADTTTPGSGRASHIGKQCAPGSGPCLTHRKPPCAKSAIDLPAISSASGGISANGRAVPASRGTWRQSAHAWRQSAHGHRCCCCWRLKISRVRRWRWSTVLASS